MHHHTDRIEKYHGLCYTSRGAQSGTRKSSMGPTRGIDPTTHYQGQKTSANICIECEAHPNTRYIIIIIIIIIILYYYIQ